MNMYVSNLSFHTTDTELRNLFQEFGEVSSAKVIMDKVSGRSRGFGFVEMPNDSEAKQAIAQLNGYDFSQRNLVVNEARPNNKG